MTTVDFIEEIKGRLVEEIKPWIEEQVSEMYNARISKATVSIEEAAEYTGISQSTLYIMVKEEQIPTVKYGSKNASKKQIRFRLASLDKWMDEQEQLSKGGVK
ncbi:hypothetical protein BK126_03190 [Paenibacillus sp. FSL H7-0326]|uniref:helix-turn-helix domain-containing protein n=1 Tax=Paenibacillus sp. FSL H7-0326 TaxID=1921144 RepID=UPI00096F3842|nr:helix-turn-helix domain-containing protein [Paenibacillus sp. FSL H7-0326]OMC71133.1 hypothetical protein BK126_03190 [Paenibacillus sp. FSL H7-0326]